jgi:hypothetical protein
VALGENSSAAGANSTAIGQSASAGAANSAAFGQGATVTRADQQVFGTANNTYTMRGIASDASRAAQTGPVEIVTSDANGNLATDGGRVFDELDDLEEGVAMAMALPGVGFLPDGKAGAVNASFGAYKGAFAIAGSAAFKLTDNLQLDGGIAVGLDSGDFGGRGGITFAW